MQQGSRVVLDTNIVISAAISLDGTPSKIFELFLEKKIKEINEDAVPEDKADNKFINCALTVKADIVSGDKHLLKLGNYKGVKIYGAKEFLDEFQTKE